MCIVLQNGNGNEFIYSIFYLHFQMLFTNNPKLPTNLHVLVLGVF